jgi:hypothetical protein
MASCKYCSNLEIPSYQTVARSRMKGGYDGLSVIPSAMPRGLKPAVDIALEDILSGASVTRCDACIMLKGALLATFNGSLKDVISIECRGSSQNTLNVTVSLNRGYRNLEFYTLGGKFCSAFFSFSAARAKILHLPLTASKDTRLPFL